MPNAFIEGIDCTIKVNKKATTNTRILKAINTREALNKFSMRIWRKDRFIFMLFQTFELVKDEISRSNALLREFPDFIFDNFITINKKLYYNKGLPSKVADLRIVSATITAGGDNGA